MDGSGGFSRFADDVALRRGPGGLAISPVKLIHANLIKAATTLDWLWVEFQKMLKRG